jgi:hypothetical protein
LYLFGFYGSAAGRTLLLSLRTEPEKNAVCMGNSLFKLICNRDLLAAEALEGAARILVKPARIPIQATFYILMKNSSY